MINIHCPSRYKINRKLIKDFVNNLCLKKNIPLEYEINLIFIGKNKMRTIANQYKNEDEALPVLSFPYHPQKDKLLGEIFICYPQTILLAAHREKKVDETINQLIAHGLENLIINL